MRDYDYEQAMVKTEARAKELGLSHADYFTGTHRGIRFKINRHNSYDFRAGKLEWEHSTWCYYIYLKPQNFNPDDWVRIFESKPEIYERSSAEKQICRKSDILDGCDFHGGITYFHAESDPADPEQVLVEVGCDYSHLWDMEAGYPYGIEGVLSDVERTIDKLHDTVPLNVWSYIDGTYHPEAVIESYNKAAHEKMNADVKVEAA